MFCWCIIILYWYQSLFQYGKGAKHQNASSSLSLSLSSSNYQDRNLEVFCQEEKSSLRLEHLQCLGSDRSQHRLAALHSISHWRAADFLRMSEIDIWRIRRLYNTTAILQQRKVKSNTIMGNNIETKIDTNFLLLLRSVYTKGNLFNMKQRRLVSYELSKKHKVILWNIFVKVK